MSENKANKSKYQIEKDVNNVLKKDVKQTTQCLKIKKKKKKYS